MTADTRTPVERGITKVVSHRTGAVVYEVRWSTSAASGQRVHGYKRCRTLRDARAERAKRTTEAREGTYQPASRETVGEYAARWLDRMTRTRWATSTAYQRRHQYTNHIAPLLAGARLTAVTRADCQRVIDHLTAAGRSPATVQNVAALLSGLLTSAEAEGIISSNPAKHVALPSARRTPPVTWTAAQCTHFLSSTKDDPDHPLYVLLLTTGLRIGEAQALRWEHVDLAAATVTVAETMRRTASGAMRPGPGTKTAGVRTVPLTPACVAALTAHQARQAAARRAAKVWDVRGYVFAGAAGAPFEPETMRRHLDEAIARAGLPRITAHGFRRTYTTLLIEAGASVKAVSDLLGHTTVAMTLNVYTGTSAAHKRAAVAGLDALTGAGDDDAKAGGQ